MSEQRELALVIAAAEGWERQDLTADVFEDFLQTAAEVLSAGFRKVGLVTDAKAEAWDEGFDRGFYDPLAGSHRDASESLATNPYRAAGTRGES